MATRVFAFGDQQLSLLSGAGPTNLWKQDVVETGTLRCQRLGVRVGAYDAARQRPTIEGGALSAGFRRQQDVLLIALGDHDCRLRILRLASERHCNVEVVARETADQFFNTLIQPLLTRSRFGRIVVWGPHATSPTANPPHLAVGDVPLRNRAVHAYNKQLAARCAPLAPNVAFATLADVMVDGEGGTKEGWFADRLHLRAEKRAFALERVAAGARRTRAAVSAQNLSGAQ